MIKGCVFIITVVKGSMYDQMLCSNGTIVCGSLDV